MNFRLYSVNELSRMIDFGASEYVASVATKFGEVKRREDIFELYIDHRFSTTSTEEIIAYLRMTALLERIGL